MMDRQELELFTQALKLVSKKYDDKIDPHESKKSSCIYECENCENDNCLAFETDDSYRVCLNCGLMERMFTTEISLLDCSRINMRKKPVYDQVSYFKNCMMQYQCKQNSKTPDKLLADLQNKFKDGNISVTRDKIVRFLKELQYNKQSKNVNLIYFDLTKKPIDDISYLEDVLVLDLETLLREYKYVYIMPEDKSKALDRKNFLNIPSLLFQLLRNRDHPCEMSNFNILKTSSSMKFHNDVTRNLFKNLGWKFTPLEAIR